MKKLLVFALAAILSATAFCSCSMNTNTNDGSSSQVSDNSSEQSGDASSSDSDGASSDNNSSDAAATKADALFNWTFKLEGEEYTLPCDISQFLDNGWNFSKAEDADETLDKNSYTFTDLKKDDKSISVDVWNPGDDKAAFKDCKVGTVEVKLSGNAKLELSDGFVFDSSATSDSIMERYGNPEDTRGMLIEGDDNKYVSLKYEYAAWQSVDFMLYNGDLKNSSSIEIQNMAD